MGMLLGKGCVVGYGWDFGAGAVEEVRAGMSGGYWREEEVRGDFAVVGAEAVAVVEMAGSSAMPGWGA